MAYKTMHYGAYSVQINRRVRRVSFNDKVRIGVMPGTVKELLTSKEPGRISALALRHNSGMGSGERKA